MVNIDTHGAVRGAATSRRTRIAWMAAIAMLDPDCPIRGDGPRSRNFLSPRFFAMRSSARVTGSCVSHAVVWYPMLARTVSLGAILCATLVLAPSIAGAQGRETRFVAPTDATVTTHIEEGPGERPYQVIWIQNASTVPIQVYSVTLRNCENIKQICSPVPLNLRVRPGGREVLRRVEPRNPEAGFSFRYTFGWHADSSDVAALRALAETGLPRAQQQLEANTSAAAEQRVTVGAHDVELGSGEITALGAQIARLRIVPDSVVMHVGQLLPVHQVRVLAIGAQGELLGRVRAYNWRVLRGVVTAQPDTVIAARAGRTTVEFRLSPPAAPLVANLPIIVVADTTQ